MRLVEGTVVSIVFVDGGFGVQTWRPQSRVPVSVSVFVFMCQPCCGSGCVHPLIHGQLDHWHSPTTAVRKFVPLRLTKPDDIVIFSKFYPQRTFCCPLFVLLFIILVLNTHNIYFILLSMRVQSFFCFFYRYCFIAHISPLWNYTCYLILNFQMVHPVVYQQTWLILHSCSLSLTLALVVLLMSTI